MTGEGRDGIRNQVQGDIKKERDDGREDKGSERRREGAAADPIFMTEKVG